jgi:hypothetical protein
VTQANVVKVPDENPPPGVIICHGAANGAKIRILLANMAGYSIDDEGEKTIIFLVGMHFVVKETPEEIDDLIWKKFH